MDPTAHPKPGIRVTLVTSSQQGRSTVPEEDLAERLLVALRLRTHLEVVPGGKTAA
jgi:hypothetical protein